MRKIRILVVDDEKLIRWSFMKNLEKEGYEVVAAASAEEALELVGQDLPDLAILDIRLPGMDGLQFLREIKTINPETLVIMMTAHGAVETAVEAMRDGAYDYLSKPVEFRQVNILIKRALKTIRLQEEVSWLRHKESDRLDTPSIVGRSAIMRPLCDLVEKVAQGEANTVLLEGESGTGKDLFATTIHKLSQRSQGPFLDVNCSAMQETLIESELFGYEKGAFTDAKTSKKGLFELADGGTLYLDEIGEISIGSQAKLLKFIENRCFKRVGGVKDIFVDVRIIAATNKDLKDAVKQGRFREDLYFRLKVIPMTLPPLRERVEDIPLLVEYFVARFNREIRRNVQGVSEDAMDLLKRYPWPGNIRELRNILERVMLLEDLEWIQSEHFPLEILSAPRPEGDEYCLDATANTVADLGLSIPDGGVSLEEIEKNLLQTALSMASGNQTRAARLLHLTRDTLRYRMKKFGLC